MSEITIKFVPRNRLVLTTAALLVLVTALSTIFLGYEHATNPGVKSISHYVDSYLYHILLLTSALVTSAIGVKFVPVGSQGLTFGNPKKVQGGITVNLRTRGSPLSKLHFCGSFIDGASNQTLEYRLHYPKTMVPNREEQLFIEWIDAESFPEVSYLNLVGKNYDTGVNFDLLYELSKK